MNNEDLALQIPAQEETAITNQQIGNLAENTKLMNTIYKLSNMYAKSNMVPQIYQNKPENCFVAIELAGRMNVSPVLVMQNLYIVQGKPSWAGQACIALVNGCGRFEPLDFVFVGEKGQLNYGCYCVTKRKTDGRTLNSTTVDLQMAKNEGWSSKSGSKWTTMTEQMMMYRCASFFARVYCPDVLMGFQTVEEMQDVSKPESEKITIKL
jgi:hypothetical protein